MHRPHHRIYSLLLAIATLAWSAQAHAADASESADVSAGHDVRVDAGVFAANSCALLSSLGATYGYNVNAWFVFDTSLYGLDNLASCSDRSSGPTSTVMGLELTGRFRPFEADTPPDAFVGHALSIGLSLDGLFVFSGSGADQGFAGAFAEVLVGYEYRAAPVSVLLAGGAVLIPVASYVAPSINIAVGLAF